MVTRNNCHLPSALISPSSAPQPLTLADRRCAEQRRLRHSGSPPPHSGSHFLTVVHPLSFRCAEQRRLHASGALPTARRAALDGLGLSWRAPSDVDDPAEAWEAMCARLRAYQREHQNTDVPKKFKPAPRLGGWVAAVRRCRAALSEAHVAELEEIGFEWTSSRKCGSAFQDSLRRLRAFWAEHGHTDVHRVLGAEDELSLWCESQRAAWRDGRLSPKRSAPLEELGLLEGTHKQRSVQGRVKGQYSGGNPSLQYRTLVMTAVLSTW